MSEDVNEPVICIKLEDHCMYSLFDCCPRSVLKRSNLQDQHMNGIAMLEYRESVGFRNSKCNYFFSL